VTHHLYRTLLRTLAVISIAVALPLASAGAASAEGAEGWSDPEAVDFMHTLLVLVGIPLLVILLLALAVYVPPIVRGESVAPAGARADDEWFGGRRDAEKALEASTSGSGDQTGGASGSW
jgi:hypothetical protein